LEAREKEKAARSRVKIHVEQLKGIDHKLGGALSIGEQQQLLGQRQGATQSMAEAQSVADQAQSVILSARRKTQGMQHERDTAKPRISRSEMRIIDSVLEMESGWVLDFSNRTMREFFEDEFDTNIYDERYKSGSGSKATYLRQFLQIERSPIVGKVLMRLLRYRLDYKPTGVDATEVARVRSIALRLGAAPARDSSAHAADEAVPEVATLARGDVGLDNSGEAPAQKAVPTQGAAQEPKFGAGQAPQRADLAIVTILPEEYEAVLECLDSYSHIRDGQPNLYSWVRGSVRAGEHEYSVVVAMSGDPTNSISTAVTIATVTRFRPRYVVVCGVAGGFPAPESGVVQELGDVVVSSVIHGYEYGKIQETGYAPRSENSRRADIGLLNAARGFLAQRIEWAGEFRNHPPRPDVRHNVRVGPVASGDKVVDNPSNAFFAAVLKTWPKILAVEMEGAGATTAIEQLQSMSLDVGFMMIRGICDIPGVPDLAGTSVRDCWKPHAAEAAARFLFAVLRHQWPMAPLNAPACDGARHPLQGS
jgi:nucleoside phosphorylase